MNYKTKKILSIFLAIFIFISIIPLNANASDEYTSDNFHYKFKNGEAIVTGIVSQLDNIVIPNTLFGYTVTGIDKSAFYGCRNIKTVTIPNGVKSIGDNAFGNCSALESITIPNSVTSIGSSAFYKCTSLTSLSITNGVTSIENQTFYGCSSLENITISDSVTSIGDSAFYDCSSLTNISISKEINSIGLNAFAYCSSLNRVDITDLDAWFNIDFYSFASNPLGDANKLYLNGKEVSLDKISFM